MHRTSFAALLLVAANAVAGITYRFESTAAAGRVIADGPKMRVEFTRGDRVIFQDSSVVLSTDGGKTLTLLDPARKTFVVLDVGELLGALTIANSKVSARDLGDGGTIEGYPTRKWSLDASYDVVIADTRTHVTMHSDSWRTDRIPEEVRFNGHADPIERMMPPNVKGFPLKEVTTIRTRPPGGREATAVSTMGVHDLRRVTTTPAQFAIPAGYKRAARR